MNTQKALYIILPLSAILILFFFFSGMGKKLGRRHKRPKNITSTQGTIFGDTLGLRNNNPGNVRPVEGNDKWEGQIGVHKGVNGSFSIFVDVEHGLRASIRNLKTYNKKHGLNTIEECITRWAPPKENNTEAYINTVSNRTGIARNKILNFSDATEICAIAQAMCFVETSSNLPIELFYAGWELEKS